MIVKTEGPLDAKMFLVGEAPGEDEDRTGKPFKGRAGETLNKLLSSAGIIRSECLIGNVAKEKPPGNKIAYYFFDKKCTQPKEQLIKWMADLRDEIALYKPNIVVALGNTALWALTGKRGIKTHRGCIMESKLVPGQKVLATWHPQAVGYEWSLAFTTIMDLRKAKKHEETPDILRENRLLVTNPSKDGWIRMCKDILYAEELTGEGPPIAVDIETSSPGSHINRIGMALSTERAYSLELLTGREPKYSLDDEVELWEWTGKVLETCPTIFHNAPYDVSVIWRNQGILCKHILMDTQIAAHVGWVEATSSKGEEENTYYSLGYLASIFLDVSAWKHLSGEDHGLYNALDCANTFALYEELSSQLETIGLMDVLKYEMRQLQPAMMMQLQGIKVDTKMKDEMAKDLQGKLDAVKKKLFKEVGKEINYGSPKQVSDLLYIERGLPPQYKRRKSVREPQRITTDEEALQKLHRKTGDVVVKSILEFRTYSKSLSSFFDIETSPDGRVFTSYNIPGTTSGRWSSSKSIIDTYGSGNLQNIPQAARVFYTAPEGYVYLSADYVQAEAVVVAYLSKDRILMKMFEESFGMSPSERKEEHDIHRYTASIMFSVPMADVTKEQRDVGKVLRHACNYAAGPGVVANKLNIEPGGAKKLLSIYYDRNPHLKNWHLTIQRELRTSRTLKNAFGRRRRFMDRWGDPMLRSAYSYKPQSTVGDLLNISMCDFYDAYGHRYNLTLQLHDAMYLIVEEHEIDFAMERLREHMIKTLEIDNEQMTIDVDFKVGKSWGDMEEIDIGWI